MKIGVFPRPLCSNPSLLVNRNAVRMLLNGGELRAYKDYEYKNYQIGFLVATCQHEVDYKKLLRFGYACLQGKFNDPSIKKLSLFVVVLGDSYEFLYQVVACGHCEICTEKKLNDFSNRCQWESQTSDTRPLFVTLTYDNYNIPRWVDDNQRCRQRGIPIALDYEIWFKHEGCKLPYQQRVQQPIYQEMMAQRGLCHTCDDDIKRFLKRLRINWTRTKDIDYNKDRKLRYVRVSEYGSISQHPHVHLLLWNVPLDVDDTPIGIANQKRIEQDISKAWNMGRVESQIARDAARYVSKYVSKSDKNGNKSKRASSNRGGGIGALYLKEHKDFYLEHPTMQLIIGRDKWSGKPFQHTMGAYATNVLFPPLRSYLSKYDYSQLYETLITRVTKYLQLFQQHTDEYTFNDVACNMYDLLKSYRVIDNYMMVDVPSWSYKPMFSSNDRYDGVDFVQYLKIKEPVLLKSKQQVVDCDVITIINMLNELKFGIPSNLDYLLALRDVHKSFIPVMPMTDSMVYMKSLDSRAKQVSRAEREKF